MSARDIIGAVLCAVGIAVGAVGYRLGGMWVWFGVIPLGIGALLLAFSDSGATNLEWPSVPPNLPQNGNAGRHMETRAYPNLVRRYLAAVIDGVAIILIVVLIGQLETFRGNKEIGVIVFLLVLANYEPILTTFLCTAGQAAMRFRVRDVETGARAPIWRLYVRVVVKAFLGVISFLTLPARQDRRAIHDLAARTLVVEASNAER